MSSVEPKIMDVASTENDDLARKRTFSVAFSSYTQLNNYAAPEQACIQPEQACIQPASKYIIHDQLHGFENFVPQSPGEILSCSSLKTMELRSFTPVKDCFSTPLHDKNNFDYSPSHPNEKNLFSSTPLPSRMRICESKGDFGPSYSEHCLANDEVQPACSAREQSIEAKIEPVEENDEAKIEPVEENEEIDKELEATLLEFSLEVLRDVADDKTIELLNKSFGVDRDCKTADKYEEKPLDPLADNGTDCKNFETDDVLITEELTERNCKMVESFRTSSSDSCSVKKQDIISNIPLQSHGLVSVTDKKSPADSEEQKTQPLKMLYPDEVGDIDHPGWEVLKKLDCDERYKHVRARWAQIPPDPNRDLTYFGFRRRRIAKKWKHSPIRAPESHKRPASSSMDCRPAKRARTKSVPCTHIIDSKIENLKREYDEKEFTSWSIHNNKVKALEQNSQAAIPQGGYRYPFYDRYVESMNPMEYYNLMMRNEAEKDRLRFTHEKKLAEARKKYDAQFSILMEARNEVEKFCQFYRGLEKNNEDPTILTEKQLVELEQIEHVYELLSAHYHDPN